VMRPEFFIEDREIDLWAPLDYSAVLADVNRARKFRFLGVIGRLKPDATVDGAVADLAGIARQLEQQYPSRTPASPSRRCRCARRSSATCGRRCSFLWAPRRWCC
jgi:hypothetical protein